MKAISIQQPWAFGKLGIFEVPDDVVCHATRGGRINRRVDARRFLQRVMTGGVAGGAAANVMSKETEGAAL